MLAAREALGAVGFGCSFIHPDPEEKLATRYTVRTDSKGEDKQLGI